MQKYLIFLILAGVMTACTKEIDFDYHDIDAVVVIEGRVTNEGTDVFVSKSREMADSVRGACLTGATVSILADGVSVPVAYDPQKRRYHSDFRGQTGETYRLVVDFEGKHYEGTSTMPAAPVILSAEFVWLEVIDERMVVFEMWATDPASAERNHYWYRIDRISQHPHVLSLSQTKPYRWSVFDNRGNPPGLIYRDIVCMSERMAEEDEEDNWDNILYEGDKLALQLMSIDTPTYDYFSSLRAGQGGGANPRTNLTGGCTGYFAAGSIARADTLVFHYDAIRATPTFLPNAYTLPSQ